MLWTAHVRSRWKGVPLALRVFFGYTPGSFRVLCHHFRADPTREFFLPERTRATTVPKPPAKSSRLRERVVAMRKQNLSVYDIAAALAAEGETLSPPAIWAILSAEGFARLPRRADEERAPRVGVTPAATADVRAFDLSPREFRTDVGGLFLFVALLARARFDQIMQGAGLPGSRMVPAGAAMRSLLALKLTGAARTSHAMASVFDEGLALFAGLNVIPKRSFLTEYSCRIASASYPKLMSAWFDAIGALGLERGVSFHLDFHTILFPGDDHAAELGEHVGERCGGLAEVPASALAVLFDDVCVMPADRVPDDRQRHREELQADVRSTAFLAPLRASPTPNSSLPSSKRLRSASICVALHDLRDTLVKSV